MLSPASRVLILVGDDDDDDDAGNAAAADPADISAPDPVLVIV
jgi:hypothetical protein